MLAGTGKPVINTMMTDRMKSGPAVMWGGPVFNHQIDIKDPGTGEIIIN